MFDKSTSDARMKHEVKTDFDTSRNQNRKLNAGSHAKIIALTSDLLLYTYAHQVDVKSQKLSPYVCKMGRGA